MLKSFFKSTSLRVAAGFALGGVVFAVGNLILARVLPAREFGLISLILGLVSVSALIAPLGIDLVVTRRGFPLDAHLRRAVLGTSACVALATAIISAVVYDFSPLLALCTFATAAAAGVTQATAAHFQSRREFKISVPILQAFNWMLVAIGVATALAHSITATLPVLLVTGSGLAIAVTGWLLIMHREDGVDIGPTMSGHWREALSLVTVTAASALLMQLERLVLPATLGMEDLAVFGVLTSLVGSPFRIIQGAVAYTVVPRLRDAATVTQRRHLLRHEGFIVAAVLLLGSTVIWFAAAPLAHWLLAGRYDLSRPLVTATLISGALKVFSAFGTGVVTALAPEKGLHLLSAGSWLCVIVAAVASFSAAPWGLTGVIYAVSLGWLLRCAIAGFIAAPHLR